MAHSTSYRLRYEPDDDAQAHNAVNWELRRPQLARWRALTTDTYLLQTYRVLCAVRDTIDTNFQRRSAQISEVRAAYMAHEITIADHRQAVTDYNQWKVDNKALRDKVTERLRELVPRVRNLAGDTAYDHLHASLLSLAAAVAAHQESTTGRASTADRLLYAHLGVLTIPTSRALPGATPEATPLREALLGTMNTPATRPTDRTPKDLAP